MISRTGLGKSSHRFLPAESTKPCVIAGIIFDNLPGFQSRSDGDVVFHALCNAITSLTHIQIIGEIAAILCLKEGITDSEVYLHEAVKTLKDEKIIHVSIALEAKRPHFKEYILEMRENIARVLKISSAQVGITAIAGDGLTDVGCGDGATCLAIITVAG
jgi:2-C-methyl-D-erythritol 2,4-cyclodiphosphate synthase